MENLKYPIGKFDKTVAISPSELKTAITTLKDFPALLRSLTDNIKTGDLEKTYRPGGWNVRQVVHHVADSHANMYIRLKCALTEENPTIKGYSEAAWAELSDSSLPIYLSVNMVETLHARIVSLLENMTEEEFNRTFYHPGYDFTYKISTVVALYAWHSTHHLEHILIALKN